MEKNYPPVICPAQVMLKQAFQRLCSHYHRAMSTSIVTSNAYLEMCKVPNPLLVHLPQLKIEYENTMKCYKTKRLVFTRSLTWPLYSIVALGS